MKRISVTERNAGFFARLEHKTKGGVPIFADDGKTLSQDYLRIRPRKAELKTMHCKTEWLAKGRRVGPQEQPIWIYQNSYGCSYGLYDYAQTVPMEEKTK